MTLTAYVWRKTEVMLADQMVGKRRGEREGKGREAFGETLSACEIGSRIIDRFSHTLARWSHMKHGKCMFIAGKRERREEREAQDRERESGDCVWSCFQGATRASSASPLQDAACASVCIATTRRNTRSTAGNNGVRLWCCS